MTSTPQRLFSGAIAVVLISTLGLTGSVSALDALASPGASASGTTTTTIEATTTIGSAGSTVSTSIDSTSTSTAVTGTGAGDVPLHQNDDDLVGRGFYAGQGPFDPASKLALPGQVDQAQTEAATAQRRLRDAQATLDQATQRATDLQSQLDHLQIGQRQAIEEAAKARTAFTDRAVLAFMQGRETESFALFGSTTPIDYARRTQMLSAVLDSAASVAADYQRQRDALGGELRVQLDQVAAVAGELAADQATLDMTTAVAAAAGWQLRTFQNNSQVWVPGFVFPVDGPVQFVDSFGYPRQVGTGQQHWHEGCDLMAPMGSPLVAVEDGVVTKVGENGLGGLSLKITGASGHWYYYAHLSSFAPDLVEGMPVAAGTLLGYVGNTGDAAGGPTHVHFEVHQPDGQVVDSFGLLKTAWQARQEQLDLGGIDPVTPPDPASHPDPGTVAGFSRFPDGRPVFADPAQQPAIDPNAPVPLANGSTIAPP
jgi:murein DD-endopeptidase MepM/ murein hydrolase activator NlpD